MAFMARIWSRYEASLGRSPVSTKMCTSFTLMLSGDVFAQTLDPEVKTFDLKRTASMAVLGGLCHAPYFHFWYRWLDNRFVGTAMKTIAPKLALELTTAGPGYLAIVLAYTTTVRTGDVRQVWPKIEKDFLTMYGSGVRWLPFPCLPACLSFLRGPSNHNSSHIGVVPSHPQVAFHGLVQAFNFRFVPSRQRILYDNCVSLMWKTFLSFYANRGPSPSEESE